MKMSEISTKTVKQLLEDLFNLKKEQFNNRFQKVSGEAVKPSRTRELKKVIARIKTRLNELKKKG
jgi:large subunit ribosomal protein L29